MRSIVCADGSKIKIGRTPSGGILEPMVRIEVLDMGAARLSPSDARQVAAALLNYAASIDKQQPDGRAVSNG